MTAPKKIPVHGHWRKTADGRVWWVKAYKKAKKGGAK